MSEDKRYLADGVYADWDGYHVVLTTENGISIQNTIYIDEVVWAALVDYVESLKEKARHPGAEGSEG